MFNIPVIDVQSGENQSDTQDEESLKEDNHRQEKKSEARPDVKEKQGRDQHQESEEKVEEVDQYDREGQDFPGEVDFFNQVAVIGNRAGAHGDGGAQEGPGQEGAEEENRKIFHFRAHQVFKDHRIDRQHEQRVEQGPEETQGSPFVFHFQVP